MPSEMANYYIYVVILSYRDENVNSYLVIISIQL
jgi:hypothetical protein